MVSAVVGRQLAPKAIAVGLLCWAAGACASSNSATPQSTLDEFRSAQLGSLGTVRLGERLPEWFPTRADRPNWNVWHGEVGLGDAAVLHFTDDGVVWDLTVGYPNGFDPGIVRDEVVAVFGEPMETWGTSGEEPIECLIWWDSRTRVELLTIYSAFRGTMVNLMAEDRALAPTPDGCASMRNVGSIEVLEHRGTD